MKDNQFLKVKYFLLLSYLFLVACGGESDDEGGSSNSRNFAEFSVGGDSYSYRGLSASTLGDYGSVYFRESETFSDKLIFTFASQEYSEHLAIDKEIRPDVLNEYSDDLVYVDLSVNFYGDDALDRALGEGLGLDDQSTLGVNYTLFLANGDVYRVYTGSNCIGQYHCSTAVPGTLVSFKLNHLKVDENETSEYEPNHNRSYEPKSSLGAEIELEFEDESGDVRTDSVRFSLRDVPVRSFNNYFLAVSKDRENANGSGGDLVGCWDNGPIDAWCFNSNGEGQYIQYSVNGNPGTMYITFDYSVDYSTNTLRTRNTYIELVGSCCDKAESLNGNYESAPFSISGSTLELGARSYARTSSYLGN